jgi:hypothetical protein
MGFWRAWEHLDKLGFWGAGWITTFGGFVFFWGFVRLRGLGGWIKQNRRCRGRVSIFFIVYFFVVVGSYTDRSTGGGFWGAEMVVRGGKWVGVRR